MLVVVENIGRVYDGNLWIHMCVCQCTSVLISICTVIQMTVCPRDCSWHVTLQSGRQHVFQQCLYINVFQAALMHFKRGHKRCGL